MQIWKTVKLGCRRSRMCYLNFSLRSYVKASILFLEEWYKITLFPFVAWYETVVF
jgi:hypothetical protein